MNRFLSILMVLCLSVLASADNKVVSVDSNNVANVSSIEVSSVKASTAYSDRLVLDSSVTETAVGLLYVPAENRVITIPWPTNYVHAYTNYPGNNRNYTDPLVTEWLMNKTVEDLRADLLVFGDKDFYARYTNSPPENIQSLLGYVSNCVYLLSNVKVQMSYNTVSNEIEELKTRVGRTEATADRFGSGVTDLDYIIDSDIDNMDAGDMLDMIKVLASYIKTGAAIQPNATSEEPVSGE